MIEEKLNFEYSDQWHPIPDENIGIIWKYYHAYIGKLDEKSWCSFSI